VELNGARPQTGVMLARLGAALLLLAAALLVLRPFLTALLWAAIVAYVTWPLYRRARDRTGWPRATAALFTLAFLLCFGVPLSWFLVALAEQGTLLIAATQDWLRAGAPQPAWVSAIPGVGPALDSLRQQFLAPGEIATRLTGIAGQLSQRIVQVARGAASNVFSFSITLLVLYAFYVEGERLIAHARRLAGVALPNAHNFLEDVGGVVRAVVFGLVGTAIVQGIVAAIGFTVFGVPGPAALGALTSVLSFLPAGPVFVWGGAAIWLFVEGETARAIGMAVYGTLLVSSVDNILRPILISRGGAIPIPFLVVFFGVIGGLAAFGLLGLFLGPVVLSVTFALIAEFPGHATAAAAVEREAKAPDA
jgi:predicted PurR-regulated permease PerM